MALHKRKPVKSEVSAYDKLITQLSEQTKQLSELNKRMDSLIESDKAIHEQMTKKTNEVTEPEKKEPEIKTEESDTTDKADEHAEKIENA